MQNANMKHRVQKGWRALLLLTFSLCVGCGFLSCDNQHCDEPMYSPIGISCLSELNPSEKYSLLRLSLLPVGADTLLTNVESGQFYLPLNPTSAETKYVWCMLPKEYETVEVSMDTVWQDSLISEVKFNIEGESLSLKKVQNDLLLFADNSMLYYYNGVFAKPMTDTLNISYEAIHEFVSGECGYRTAYELKSVDFTHGVGEVFIESNMVTNKYKENHVNIYMSLY
ncbi:MAG: DUF6452 family protein [Paludibacteraceae bacterium]|nr:DUF6452 family protein [Paludibacteraceae bacterium]